MPKQLNHHPEAVTIQRRLRYGWSSNWYHLQIWSHPEETDSGWLNRIMCLLHLNTMWVTVEFRWRTTLKQWIVEGTANGTIKFYYSPGVSLRVCRYRNGTTSPENNRRYGWQCAQIPLSWTQQKIPQLWKQNLEKRQNEEIQKIPGGVRFEPPKIRRLLLYPPAATNHVG